MPPTAQFALPQYVQPGQAVVDEISAAKSGPPDGQSYCDLIMKGGITSGIVYPPAAVELARDYQFRNIGGTSAGAIAAALTAAAEYRRQETGSAEGFRLLATIPEQLADSVNGLSHIFAPNQQTRGLFTVITDFINARSTLAKVGVTIRAAVLHYPLWTMLGILPAVLLGSALYNSPAWTPTSLSEWGQLVIMVLGVLLLGLLGIIIPFVWRVMHEAKAVLPRHAFGLTGIAPVPGAATNMTTWLHEQIQAISGKPPDQPLTYGDLWTAGMPPEERAAFRAEIAKLADSTKKEKQRQQVLEGKLRSQRRINLEMVTTNLSEGRPYVLPFRTGAWSYSLTEHQRLFPRAVCQYLVSVSKAMPPASPPDPRADIPGDLYTLRSIADLPILLPTRMSLSFPILIAAVPLYKPNYRNKDVIDAWYRHWFSDGGLCSNFPIDFFDGPVPRWPTFGINLRPLPRRTQTAVPVATDRVRMPQGNESGTRETWRAISGPTMANPVLSLLSAIFDAMQNWADNTRINMDGIYDRVADVQLAPDEGGMNLGMPREKILWIASLGEAAGQRIRRTFHSAAHPAELPITERDAWINHCWVRCRNVFALIEELVETLGSRLTGAPQHLPWGWSGLIAQSEQTEAHGYEIDSAAQREHLTAMVQAVETLGESVEHLRTGEAADGPNYRHLVVYNGPARRPVMGTRPRLDR